MEKFVENFNKKELTVECLDIDTEVNPVWDEKSNRYHYVLEVTYDNKSEQFDFWGSIKDFNEGNIEMDEEDLISALCMEISDGLAFENSKDYIDFCEEMGYDDFENADYYNDDTDLIDYSNCESFKVYKGCEEAFNKMSNLFSTNEMVDLLEKFEM